MMRKTACVFPGQGSQYVGMLADFALQYPVILQTFSEASDAATYDLWRLVQEGPAEHLNQTEQTQVAVLTADVAIYRLLQQQHTIQPLLMAGHSLGEYAALVCADALTLFDAASLVINRGRLMQKAVPLGVGAMAAIVGLTKEQVQALCEQAEQENQLVSPANYNAIGQVVIAGHTAAVNRTLLLAEQAGALLAKIIPVSVPCHCPLLREAAESFEAYLNKTEFKKPAIDVVSNVDLSSYQSADHIREKLKEQLYNPVRWVETIQLFKNHGIELILECGPSKVLSGLIKRIERSVTAISICDTISFKQLDERLA